MTDPYASPPAVPTGSDGEEPSRQPSGPPPQGSAAPAAGRVGVAALIVGVLALLTSVSILGGVVLGAWALLLGARGRSLARLRGTSTATATAGIVLGALGMAAAGAVYLWVRDDLRDYQACRLGSVSLAQDRACQDAFERSLTGR